MNILGGYVTTKANRKINELVGEFNVPTIVRTTLLNIHPTGGAASIKAHAHSCTAEYANEFKGEFLNASGTMDGIAAHYHMSPTGGTGTGVMRSILGVAYLDAGMAITGTSATASWISGGLFSCSLAATSTLNGTAVIAYGMYAEVTGASGSVLTSVKHIAGAAIYNKCLVKPTSGESSILHLCQAAGSTTVNQAIYLEGGATIDAFATFDVAGTDKAVSTAVVSLGGRTTNTTHAVKIKVGGVSGYIPVYAAATF